MLIGFALIASVGVAWTSPIGFALIASVGVAWTSPVEKFNLVKGNTIEIIRIGASENNYNIFNNV